jgi:PIN domain nuclease of toxin-antitoxin system
MRYLLDTCTFIWLISDPRGLSKVARQVIEDGDSACFFSVISSWEIITKNRLGKLDVDTQGQTLDAFLRDSRVAHELETLGMDEPSVGRLNNLPDIHRDPFDRMLICQAIEHQLVLVTPDPHIQRYPIKTLW